jgi:predicted ATPase/DNA-binding SARP family transcriptional activator
MRFGILGPTRVELTDGREVAVGGSRLRALLALLLVDADHLVVTERLIDGLYGEDAPTRAVNALQSQVSRLRHLLAGSGLDVERQPSGYRLAVDPESVDVHRFERLATEGQRALVGGDHQRAAELLTEALGQWRGPALADVGDAPFAPRHRARLDGLRLAVRTDRIEAELAMSSPTHDALVAELQDLVAAHPLRERLRVLLMRALYGAGRHAEALEAFEDARRTLADELGADPSAELADLHVAILRADPSLAGGEPPIQRGLPAQLTSFVGRDAELSRVAKMLRDARLVTLTGPGGAGKTRLAIEVAARWPGDVCFVELAPVGPGVDASVAVLGSLGVREAGLLPQAARGSDPAPDVTSRLVAALADRRMLLVLDNCEHLIDSAARLCDRLLGACPLLGILSTSREGLRITGETIWTVQPLAVAPADSTRAEASSFPAVRLFADRAAAVQPDFDLDAANTVAVQQICEALDGLPLAIELAAARLRSMSVDEIASRLDDRFRLLSRGDRSASPRHQTLRAVVGWSWDLLDEGEQRLARCLTVFPGGATVGATERVCGLPDVDVLDALTSLADKSFIEIAGGRYRMLDTVRAFCAERLAESGPDEADRLRRAHAAYFLDLAQTADPHLRDAEQLGWLERLDAEHDNVTHAVREAIQAGDTDVALQVLAAMSGYWWLRGVRSECAVLALELLTAVGPQPPPGLEEEHALCVLTAAAGGVVPDLPSHLERVRAVVFSSDKPPQNPFINLRWATLAGPPAEPEIVELFGQQLSRRLDAWSLALTHLGWGLMRLYGGAGARAEEELEAALAGFRALGERWGMSNALAPLAVLADWRGDSARSVALTDEAIELTRQLGSTDDMAELLCGRADLAVRRGDLAAAESDYERAAHLGRRACAPEKVARAHLGLGEIARLRGDLERAAQLCRTALAECPTGWFGAEEVRSWILIAMGWIAQASGDSVEAATWHRRALTTTLSGGGMTVAAGVAEGLAGVALLEGEGKRAALLLGVARVLRGAIVVADPDVDRVSAAARAEVGDAAYDASYAQGAAMSHAEALAVLGAPPSAKSPAAGA